MILRKLLASSTFAIAGTLEGMAERLDEAASAAGSVGEPPEELPEDWEDYDELADEWDDEDADKPAGSGPDLTPEELAELKREAAELCEFHALAKSILKNSKGEVLLTALRRGFEAATRARGKDADAAFHQKAVIFTESRRTQEYLFDRLEQTEFKDKVMLFNGTNNDPRSKAIYSTWLARHEGTDKVTASRTANMRQALVEHFRDPLAIAVFLPTSDGRLLCRNDTATLFFQPVRGADDAAEFVDDVPGLLKGRVAFLHNDVQTVQQDGATRRNTAVQKFLDERFARSFRREDILREVVIGALPALPVEYETDEAAQCAELLSWALKLVSSGSDEYEKLMPLLGRLPVPCHAGW